MVTWKLKGCPRCRGDIFVHKESDGIYEHCLSCGYQRDISSIIKAEQHNLDTEPKQLAKLPG